MYQVLQRYGSVIRSYSFSNRADAMEFLSNLGIRAYNKGYAIVPEKHAYVECTYHFVDTVGTNNVDFELISIPEDLTTHKIDIPHNLFQ